MQLESFEVAHVLEQANEFIKEGDFFSALSVLNDDCIRYSHSEYWSGMIAISKARAQFHLWDHSGALLCLGLIPKNLRLSNPKIDAEYNILKGMIARRIAHQRWKEGSFVDAKSLTDEAINAFENAINASRMALDDKLKYGAILNKQYAYGLLMSIDARAKSDFVNLFVDAVKADSESRKNTPPARAYDNILGLAIVVDLALGAGIEPFEVWDVSSSDQEYKAACLYIFGAIPNKSWPELILNNVRALDIYRPELVALVMILGAKILSTSKGHDHELLFAYATELRFCQLTLMDTGNCNQTLNRISAALSTFPDDIIRRVCRAKYFR